TSYEDSERLFNLVAAPPRYVSAGNRNPLERPYLTLGFRSFLMQLTMSLAVRSICFEVLPLGGWYIDQTTWRDLASTRKMVPLLRPNDELDAGFDSLFTVSPSNGLGSSTPFSA